MCVIQALNGSLIGEDQILFQKTLEEGFQDLKRQISQFVSLDEATTSNAAAMGELELQDEKDKALASNRSTAIPQRGQQQSY